jgi:hypothetical protein
MRSTARAFALAIVGVLVASCQELQLTNPNEPDRGHVTSRPEGVEALISSGFSGWWQWVHQNEPTWALSTMADEFTGAFTDFAMHHSSQEPRPAWNNNPTFNEGDTSEDPWDGLHRVISNLNDALAAMNRGVVPADSARARAVARFVQGLSYGVLAVYYDSAFIVNETVNVDSITLEAPPPLFPYWDVRDTAIARLEEALSIAQLNTFTIPGPPGWFRTPMTNTDLARLANSWIARFLVSTPRDRAARDTVPWARVLGHAEQGIQAAFTPEAEPNVFDNGFAFRAARQRTTTPGDFARIDNWLVGPADSTNAFIGWVNTAVQNRERITIRTKDRRIHAASGSTVAGKYFGHHTASVWDPSRGTYHRSRYYFLRFGRGTSWEEGPQLAMTVTEMDLIRAEALIRLNRAVEAVPLINATRVINGELPPVTVDGPPDEPGCVPRKYMPGPTQGQCGSLWDALRYEKRIEIAGVDPTVAFADARGWQTLVQNTYIQLPVPGSELGTLERPLYTYGGGLASSAPAPDPERCPVALPRCP